MQFSVLRALFASGVVLFMSATLWAGIASTVYKPSETDLETRGYTFMGENFADKFDEIKGAETHIRVYQLNDELIGLYTLPNQKVYAFARKTAQEPITGFLDKNNDDYCEDVLVEGEDFTIDFAAYKIDVNASE